MTEYSFFSTLGALLLFLVHLAVIARVILRPHREPASRIAWIVMIIALPVVGMVSYLLLGETNIGRRRVRRMREMLAGMPSVADAPGADAPALQAQIPERHSHLFRVGHSVNGFEPVGGNRGRLLADSNATIESMVADIDAAQDHVHLTFYIWLPDNNGLKVVEALKRAAARKVTCRAMADGLGSRTMIGSEHWNAMRDAGVHVATALPIGNLLLRPLRGRIDLRNHRKILVIDNRITYCGSQNCADPEFRIKAKYAPWVDAMMRFEGPIARQNQHLFVSDWMAQVNEDISELLAAAAAARRTGFDRAGDRHGADGAQFRHARGVRDPDVCRPAGAGHHHALLRAQRSACRSALCASACRGVDDDHHLSGPERLLDRGGGQPQLLRRPARRRRPDLRIPGRPAAHQVAHPGRRDDADRVRQHGPPQLRPELREQHPVLRSGPDRRNAPPPGRLPGPIPPGDRRDGGPVANHAPALEQHHRDARPRVVS